MGVSKNLDHNNIIDADGHILEPSDTWEKYIDPKFRARAIRVRGDDEGQDRLFFDDKPSWELHGRPRPLG